MLKGGPGCFSRKQSIEQPQGCSNQHDQSGKAQLKVAESASNQRFSAFFKLVTSLGKRQLFVSTVSPSRKAKEQRLVAKNAGSPTRFELYRLLLQILFAHLAAPAPLGAWQRPCKDLKAPLGARRPD